MRPGGGITPGTPRNRRRISSVVGTCARSGVTLVVLSITACRACSPVPPPQVVPQFSKLNVGMTRAEVIETLGAEPTLTTEHCGELLHYNYVVEASVEGRAPAPVLRRCRILL